MNLSREEWARLTTPNCVQGFCSFNPPPLSLRTKNEKIVTLDRETNFVNSIWEYKSRWNLNTTDLVSNFFLPSLIHLHIYESHSTGFSFIFVKLHWFPCHCTKMYPMTLRCCSPLSGFVPICLEVFRLPSCTKVDSRITAVAMLSLVGNYADSCFRVKTVTDSIETGRSAPSTRHDLMTCHGIVRQRSVNKESSPVFEWQ